MPKQYDFLEDFTVRFEADQKQASVEKLMAIQRLLEQYQPQVIEPIDARMADFMKSYEEHLPKKKSEEKTETPPGKRKIIL